jgi:diadenosine tetraphosphate (Ap4A) HIT family hydrolase
MSKVDCYSCAQSSAQNLPIRENVCCDGGWRVAHSFNSSLPGWLVIVPLRHISSPDEMTDEEAEALGRLIRDASVALKRTTNCEKTYVMMFAEAEGFSHVHFHLVPRMSDLPDERRGPRILAYLKETPLSFAAQDEIAQNVRNAWPARE